MTLLDVVMRQRRVTNRALAREIGVSITQVARWRRGQFRPLPAHAEKLAAVFGIAAEELAASVSLTTHKRT